MQKPPLQKSLWHLQSTIYNLNVGTKENTHERERAFHYTSHVFFHIPSKGERDYIIATLNVTSQLAIKG